MDVRQFYRGKVKDRHVREIPSESEDSELDSSGSDEEWTPEQGLSRIEKNRA